MQAVTTIGLDIAKSVFQVHGVKAGGRCGCSWSRRGADCNARQCPADG